jgi:hypothetical protein
MAVFSWMWADANFIGNPLGLELAKLNPGRWSSEASITDAIQDLEANASSARPVRLCQNRGSPQEFGSVREAVDFLKAQAGGPPAAGAGPIDDHIAMLRKHIDENKEKFRRSQDEVARFIFSKMVEIDEKGTAVIDEGDLVEYCTSLASILDEEEPGLAMKLQQEICQQKTRMGSGTLQPLVKTSVVGVDNAGAFSVVQVFAKWDNNDEIQVTYSQMGRSWSVPQGQPSPTTEVMCNYYQYKAVETMLEMLGAPASGVQPEVGR